MKFFIDSANIEEIKEAGSWGLVDGVTTNPSLIAQTGKDFHTVAKEICAAVTGPVSLEVVSLKCDEMVNEGMKLREYGENVVVKIPLIAEGIKAVHKLSSQGVQTNVTLCFQPLQALMAAKAGATYISPFVGRLDDMAQDGMALIEDIMQIYQNYQIETQVLVASCRHPVHVLESARLGAHVTTLPFKVIKQLIYHPKTDEGLANFLADWKKTQS